jgi:hypothetical protein
MVPGPSSVTSRTRRASLTDGPTPGHPTLKAAFLMAAVLLAIVVLAAISTLSPR